MYTASTVAKYVIWRMKKGDLGNQGVSNSRLQKILYFLQAEKLMRDNYPLFGDDIVASSFGPIIPDVYMNYKTFGDRTIPMSNMDRKFCITVEDRNGIDKMLKSLDRYPTSALTSITMKQSPWRKNYSPQHQNIIPNEDIIECLNRA